MRDSKDKIVGSLELAQIVARCAELATPLVFTNGCFDILHRGHVTYLQQARELGAAMVVAANTDASVKRQDKGSDRPINTLEDRMAVLASLEAVDLVVAFDDDTPLALIKAIQPSILVKGGDWKPADIVGAKEVTANGGQVHSIVFEHNRSTTQLIQKIRG
ncbi:MAG: D-glycero-beta-D-manno-heptose 1-phosphate adenylyltransferase [Pseudomonadota bacterium]